MFLARQGHENRQEKQRYQWRHVAIVSNVGEGPGNQQREVRQRKKHDQPQEGTMSARRSSQGVR